MERKLYSEIRELYMTSKEFPHVIRIKVRMCDPIDRDVLRHATDTTMERYPYFSVELKKIDGQYHYADNPRPVVITNSLKGVELNSKESNYHMVAVSWANDWVVFDVFHALTDGTGAYELVRTFLYYYCSERYHVHINGENVRLVEDEISDREWVDPIEGRTDLPTLPQKEMAKALNLCAAAGLEDDRRKTVYSIAIPESEFMRFNLDNDASPATMVALLLSRAIASLFPESKDVIRIILCVNQRTALKAPQAHQSLTGGATLEYKDRMRDLPLSTQGTIYRGMVFAQTQEDVVLAGVASAAGMFKMLLSKDTDEERLQILSYLNAFTTDFFTATVSYVGKADFNEAERYIRDFKLWSASATMGLTVEISAVSGRFTLEFLQHFSSPIVVDAFLGQLDQNGIAYDFRGREDLYMPNVRVPWAE